MNDHRRPDVQGQKAFSCFLKAFFMLLEKTTLLHHAGASERQKRPRRLPLPEETWHQPTSYVGESPWAMFCER